MNPNGGEVTFQWLNEIVARCSGGMAGHPAGHYLIHRICQRMVDEYNDQGIPTARAIEHQQMRQPIGNALTSPEDIHALNELAQAAIRLGFE